MKPTTLVLGFVAGVAAATGVFWFTSRPTPAPPTVAARPLPPEQPPAPVAVAELPKPEPPKPEPPRTAPTPKPKPEPPKKQAAVTPAPPPEAPPEIPEPTPPAIPVLAPATIPETPPVTNPQPVVPTPERTPPPPPPGPNTVTLSAGTLITVRLGETLASNRSRADDTFLATLDQPIVAEGFVIAEKGSRVEGRVVEVLPAGRLKGTARLVIELTRISTADGQKIAVRTATFLREAESSKGDDIKRIGIATVIGAAIGAAANGGKGAAIGAAAGGAAGAGTIAITRGNAAVLETETRISFRLNEPVTITERL